MHIKLHLFPYPSILTCVLDAQKNCLIETILLSTHNICIGLEIRKIIFQCADLSGGQHTVKTGLAPVLVQRDQRLNP